ncbi:MAG: DUF4838 domain-containing protein [Ruminococcaceae bacterium]|nr:DUF4838 domain-containing protein [Oscillospiraceae bacterium]
MLKRILISFLAAVILIGAVAVEVSLPEKSVSVTASDSLKSYKELFESRADSMPDELIMAVGNETLKYGVDMTEFIDDEGFVARAENGQVVLLGKTERGMDRAVRHFTRNGNYDHYSYTYGEGYRVEKLTIMGNPISQYAVVIPDDADESMILASEELTKFICIATGVVIPVYRESEYVEAADAPSHSISYIIDYPGHGNEAFSIDVKNDGNIDILCGRYRGALYGTYGLLKDIGWRFLADGTEFIYEADLVDLTNSINRREEAAIPNRYAAAYPLEFNNYYGVRLNMHSRYATESETVKYGGYGLVAEACHGLSTHPIPWGDFADGSQTQPCFTDEELLQLLEDYYRGYIEDKLNAGAIVGYDFNYIDVAQHDMNDFCKCYTCLEVLAEEKSQAGAVLRMTNRMADMAAEYDPNIKVLMLAYQKTAALPKVTRPRDNVVVAHCFFAGDGKITCSNHCISGEDCINEKDITNKILGGDLKDWLEVCKEGTVQVWYYPMEGDEPSSLTPCYDTGFQDMKFLIENGISCVMLCGGNIFQIAAHALLMWDGDLTEEEYWDFLKEQYLIYYGEGGEELFEVSRMIIEAGDLNGCWCSFSYSDLFDKLNKAYIDSNFEYMVYLLDRAMAKAETKEIEEHIEVFLGKVYYMCLTVLYEKNYHNGTEEIREIYRERYLRTHDIFLKYHLQTYLSPPTYASPEIDFEKSPGQAWAPARYQS